MRIRILVLGVSLLALVLPNPADAAIEEFPVPTVDGFPFVIAAGPDGALWFTESSGEKIGRVTTSGSVSEFPITSPPDPFGNSVPVGIAAGPEGALWFTEFHTGAIGRSTTAGSMTTFDNPQDGGPQGIVGGP